MSTQSPISNEDPRMIAWNTYKQKPEFQNTRHWTIKAENDEQADGVLWEAFIAGWAATISAERADAN